jgi:hypothetical protein
MNQTNTKNIVIGFMEIVTVASKSLYRTLTLVYYTVVRGLRLEKTHQPLNWKDSMKRFQGPNPDRRVSGANFKNAASPAICSCGVSSALREDVYHP